MPEAPVPKREVAFWLCKPGRYAKVNADATTMRSIARSIASSHLTFIRFLRQGMIGQIWTLLKESVDSFVKDEALTRGAAIAFYTVTSIGPVPFIVVAIAGLFSARVPRTGPCRLNWEA